MINRFFLTGFFLLLFLGACSEKQNIDTEKPLIDTEFIDAFPSYCDTIYFGESFNFKAYFTDNFELGAYSINIHHNFDHHSHGHKIEVCSLALKKTPVNPLVFLVDYAIPESLKEYEVNQSIPIPASNAFGLFEEGDYHFQIFLTDKEGWSTPLGLSIKLMHRQ